MFKISILSGAETVGFIKKRTRVYWNWYVKLEEIARADEELKASWLYYSILYNAGPWGITGTSYTSREDAKLAAERLAKKISDEAETNRVAKKIRERNSYHFSPKSDTI